MNNIHSNKFVNASDDSLNNNDFINTKNTPNLQPILIKRNPYDILSDIKGIKYQAYRTRWKEAYDNTINPSYPLQLDIDITDNCNLRCRMCPQWRRPGFTNILMSKEMIKNILTEAKKNGCYSINIGGGAEPLLDKELFIYTMGLLEKLGFIDTFIHTNGLLLDDDIIHSIIQAKINNISISLGLMEDKTLLQHQIRKITNLSLFKQDRGLLKTPLIRVCYIPTSNNKKIKEQMKMKLEEMIDYIEEQDIYDGNDIVKKYTGMQLSLFRCREPLRRLSVNAKGDLSLCCFTAISPRLHLGNINTVSIKDAWNCEKTKQIRKEVHFRRIPECNTCMNLYYGYKGE